MEQKEQTKIKFSNGKIVVSTILTKNKMRKKLISGFDVNKKETKRRKRKGKITISKHGSEKVSFGSILVTLNVKKGIQKQLGS